MLGAVSDNFVSRSCGGDTYPTNLPSQLRLFCWFCLKLGTPRCIRSLCLRLRAYERVFHIHTSLLLLPFRTYERSSGEALLDEGQSVHPDNESQILSDALEYTPFTRGFLDRLLVCRVVGVCDKMRRHV